MQGVELTRIWTRTLQCGLVGATAEFIDPIVEVVSVLGRFSPCIEVVGVELLLNVLAQHRRGTCSSHGGVRQWLQNIPP
jgi:hypothetical protein